MPLTSGSQAGRRSLLTGSPQTRLGDQITRITKGSRGEGQSINAHSSSHQEHAHAAQGRASSLGREACSPGRQRRPDVSASSLRRCHTEGRRRNREGGSSVGSKDEKKILLTSVSGNPRMSEVVKNPHTQEGAVVHRRADPGPRSPSALHPRFCRYILVPHPGPGQGLSRAS